MLSVPKVASRPELPFVWAAVQPGSRVKAHCFGFWTMAGVRVGNLLAKVVCGDSRRGAKAQAKQAGGSGEDDAGDDASP